MNVTLFFLLFLPQPSSWKTTALNHSDLPLCQNLGRSQKTFPLEGNYGIHSGTISGGMGMWGLGQGQRDAVPHGEGLRGG